MDFGRTSDYGSLYNPSNRYEVKTVDLETVQKQDQEKSKPISLTLFSNVEQSEPSIMTDSKTSKTANLEDISLTFQQNESFDYIGQDKNVLSLDVEQAISDMKKDSVLQEYQYFVGSSKNLFEVNQSEDGIVIPKFY